jgi:hypothetical protein
MKCLLLMFVSVIRIYESGNQTPKMEKQGHTTQRSNNDQQNTTLKTNDLETQTPLKTGDELGCSGRMSSSCSTSGTYKGRFRNTSTLK